MCGRYAMGIRLAFIRYQLQQQGVQVDEVSEDDDVRESYNFAPGYYGAVYRADTTDQGGRSLEEEDAATTAPTEEGNGNQERGEGTQGGVKPTEAGHKEIKYRLQSMKWGLIPFWTKRSPDYGSLMRTINCRDDSLSENRGMWTSMKRRKRCIVICQGFYEWLKKGPGGKEKIPHYIKRKDGNLMCFAGLWDCVKYEDSDEKLYTYTIITTSANEQVRFIHDRMPVILEPGSQAMSTWLDPHRTTWSKELQSILKPYDGELEMYPVSKDVGKVGNNSPDFIVPLNSRENKKNIANFFAASAKGKAGVKFQKKSDPEPKEIKEETEQSNAPESAFQDVVPKAESDEKKDIERQVATTQEINLDEKHTSFKREHSPDVGIRTPTKALRTEPSKRKLSPSKPVTPSARKTRSATSNGTAPRKSEATGPRSQRITSFFKSG